MVIFLASSVSVFAQNELVNDSDNTLHGTYQVNANWADMKRGWNVLSMRITNSKDEEISEAAVNVDYDMVGMPMDPPKNPAEETTAGTYETKVFLGMRGNWKFDVKIQAKDDTLGDSLSKTVKAK